MKILKMAQAYQFLLKVFSSDYTNTRSGDKVVTFPRKPQPEPEPERKAA